MTSVLSSRFEFAAKIGLYVIVALLPLWFLPGFQNLDFGREITFGVATLLIFILWLLSVLTSGEIRYRHSPILYSALFLLVTLGISSFFSKSPLTSLFLGDMVAEKFSTIVMGVLLMMLTGSLFKQEKDAVWFALILIFSGALSALLEAIGLFSNVSLFKFLTPLAQSGDFNAVGTVNALALFYVALFFVTFGFISSSWFATLKRPIRYALYGSLALFALNLLFINFRTGWIILLGAGIFFLGLVLKDSRTMISFGAEGETARAERKKGFDLRAVGAMVILAFAVVMVMVRVPLVSRIVIPGELSPNVRETLHIAKMVFQEDAKSTIFGSGPATFGLDWGLYKNPQLNLPQMIGSSRVDLWNVRFNQGYSFVSTFAATSGIFGILALLLFFAASLFLFLKRMLAARAQEISFASAFFLGFFAAMLAAFLYPANLALILLFFLCGGVLSFLLSTPVESALIVENVSDRGWRGRFGLQGDFWKISDERVRLEQPWAVFISSLAAIFLLAISVGGIYTEAGRLRAAYLFQKGDRAIAEGKVNDAIDFFKSAADAQDANYRNHQALAQARTDAVRQLIGRAARGENVQQEFLAAVDAARLSAQRATDLNPEEPLTWRTQGALFELIIPFIPGAEQLAFSSYQRATGLDPLNPLVWTELGRSALAFADKIQLGFNQIPAKDQPQYAAARASALQEAEKAFAKGVEVKADFAPAHFLLAQVALRAGNLDAAIKSSQNAAIAAPFDIGIAFQLGLLYYQTNDLDRAQTEFERAVSLNSTYSNARYFLGLVYDRKGQRDGALFQFQEVQKFNPDNSEVQKIIQNLKSGKPALDGIVPPATPPEKRRETPVKERERNQPRAVR